MFHSWDRLVGCMSGWRRVLPRLDGPSGGIQTARKAAAVAVITRFPVAATMRSDVFPCGDKIDQRDPEHRGKGDPDIVLPGIVVPVDSAQGRDVEEIASEAAPEPGRFFGGKCRHPDHDLPRAECPDQVLPASHSQRFRQRRGGKKFSKSECHAEALTVEQVNAEHGHERVVVPKVDHQVGDVHPGGARAASPSQWLKTHGLYLANQKSKCREYSSSYVSPWPRTRPRRPLGVGGGFRPAFGLEVCPFRSMLPMNRDCRERQYAKPETAMRAYFPGPGREREIKTDVSRCRHLGVALAAIP